MMQKILLQLDPDNQPSVFDSVVAVDAGVDHLFRHGAVEPSQVRDLVYGCIFTRGGEDLKNTAIFVGGTQVGPAEDLFAQVKKTFFDPMRVSVMFDANGCNTTAAAAVIAASRHCEIKGATALVLGGTGPVGQRVARLLACAGAAVRVGSRQRDKSQAVCEALQKHHPSGQFTPVVAKSNGELEAALEGVSIVIAAGAPGVQLLSAEQRQKQVSLKVAIDLNAVPPLGLEGIDVTDKAKERDGVFCYGALGVGGTKMKIHRAALKKLFTDNKLILDAEEIFALGQEFK
jgi:methylenetetrahydrofolate/methylenetetrahydromethanopterin dehydrogenase (NADP+)